MAKDFPGISDFTSISLGETQTPPALTSQIQIDIAALGFDITGGGRKVPVLFRPTPLTRLLKFDANQDGVLSDSEKDALGPVMKASPTAIGPVLKPDQVKVWLDGRPLAIVQFNLIPEASSDGCWQVLYMLQVIPDSTFDKVFHHEIKLEVQSQEELRGKWIADFGEGSVGFSLF